MYKYQIWSCMDFTQLDKLGVRHIFSRKVPKWLKRARNIHPVMQISRFALKIPSFVRTEAFLPGRSVSLKYRLLFVPLLTSLPRFAHSAVSLKFAILCCSSVSTLLFPHVVAVGRGNGDI